MKSWIWGSIMVIVAIAASLVAGFAYQQIDWLHGLVIFFTVYGIMLLVVPMVGRPKAPMKNDCYRPFVSILIPARNEEHVIEATVRSLCGLQYRKNGKPNYEILVLDDGSTDQTPAICHRLEQELSQVRHVRRTGDRAGKGKSAVLNEGLNMATGEIIAVFDADTRVEPNFLVKTVAYLYDPQVGGVQGRVRIYNPKQNILTAVQEDEFSVLAHLVQLAKDGIGGMTALGGNGQLSRRSALEAVGGWNEMSTTEDLDLTLRLLLKGFSVRYCPEAVLWQEAVPTWNALLRQRVRWSEGFIKCVFDYTVPLMFGPVRRITPRWDGFLSLVRVLIPLWVIIGYLLIGHSYLTGVELPTQLPHEVYIGVTVAFFLVTFLGIWRVQMVSFTEAVLRVVRFWAYNFIWMLAVPLGFVSCIRNLNRIEWDKTVHRGDHGMTAVPSVAPILYRQTPGASLVEVID